MRSWTRRSSRAAVARETSGSTPSSSRYAAAASISSSRRSACVTVPVRRRSRSGSPMTRRDLPPEPVVRSTRLRALDALEHRGGEPLHEHAPKELQARGVARLVTDHLDRHPERPDELGEAPRAVTRRQRRCRDAPRRHGAEERHVREACARGRDHRGDLDLERWRGRVQIGVELPFTERRGDALRGVECVRRGRQAEHEARTRDRVGGRVRPLDAGRGGNGVPAADRTPCCGKTARDRPARLTEAEHRHLERHARRYPSTSRRRSFTS